MPTPRPETLIRPNDIVADKNLGRLGNSGSGLFDDLLDRLNAALGGPIEVLPDTAPSRKVIVGIGQYVLPTGERVAYYGDGEVSDLVSGYVDFENGTIGTGSVSGFALPTMIAGEYVKAVIQYELDSESVDVTFGNPNSSLSLATVPNVKDGFDGVCLIELHSPTGGVGDWDVIAHANMVKLWSVGGKSGGAAAPREESQTVSGGPQSVFNLSSLVVPANRKKLQVFVNGVRQVDAVHYNVTSDTQVTFVVAKPDFAEVSFRIG